MASRKTATLTANTDSGSTFTITGHGMFMVVNHNTATNDLLSVNPISGQAATARGDEMIVIDPGGFRIFEVGDQDGTVEIHCISPSAVTVSVESYEPIRTG